MFNYYLDVLKKYSDFKGRARRAEYWYFFLANFLISFGLGFMDGLLGLADEVTGYGPLGLIYSLAVIVPSIAVGVRRMHDLNKSGWYILVPFYNIILAATEGQKGQNKYGDDPKTEDGASQ
ncbi:MAG: DUF805 domain-containing protein [Patescibacteria group bacterium]|nr:DUF805 domain-containing protein [Patescibacteria group bacterium]